MFVKHPESFRSFIEMAAARESDKSKTYYHGTSSTMSAMGILKNGIDPAAMEIKHGKRKSDLRPVENRVYMTTDLSFALIYALGGIIFGHENPFKKERYGYLFVIPGEQLQDIQPDEDDVGNLMYLSSVSDEVRREYYNKYDWDMLSSYLSQIRGLKRYLTPLEQRNIDYEGKGNEVAYQARIGKKLLKHMPNWMKLLLIDAGCRISHEGKLIPSECWRIDKNNSPQLKEDGSNFFALAERIR